MYIPKHFKITDINEVWEFIQSNSFGTIVTTKEGNQLRPICLSGQIKKAMTYILLDIWLMETLSGEHLNPGVMC